MLVTSALFCSRIQLINKHACHSGTPERNSRLPVAIMTVHLPKKQARPVTFFCRLNEAL
jgi:hypothetical protein